MTPRARTVPILAAAFISALTLSSVGFVAAQALPAQIVITGTVTSEGAPVSDVYVKAEAVFDGGDDLGNDFTDGAGDYAVAIDAEHASSIVLSIADWKTYEFTDVDAGDSLNVDVDLGELVTLQVTLTASKGGEPLDSFGVGIKSHFGGSTFGLFTPADGSGTVTGEVEAFVGQPINVLFQIEAVVDQLVATTNTDLEHSLNYEVLDPPFALQFISTTGDAVKELEGWAWTDVPPIDFEADAIGTAAVSSGEAIVGKPLGIELHSYPIDGPLQSEPVTADGLVVVVVPDLFSDVTASHMFGTEIAWATYNGIVGGYDDGSFRPSAIVTRQAAAAFFARLGYADLSSPPAEPTFSDVPTTHPFYAEIEWLAAQGIANGFEDGTFRPSATVTRQAVSAYLARFAGADLSSPPAEASFPDVPVTHPFFAEIEWLAGQGITTGYSDGNFKPSRDVARQALVAFLYRYDS
jgi:hypothetical protein